jgi:hypothetical protein
VQWNAELFGLFDRLGKHFAVLWVCQIQIDAEMGQAKFLQPFDGFG